MDLETKEKPFESMTEISKKYREKFFDVMKDTFDTSSFHSIPNIARHRYKSIKTMWFFCFLFAVSASAYIVANSITDYLKFSVVSTTRNIDEYPISFPTITICNLNALNLPPTNTSEQLLLQTLNYSQLYIVPGKSNRLNYIYNRFSIVTYLGYASEKIKIHQQLGYSLKHLIVSCIFNNKDCDLKNDFRYYFDAMYGNCFKFNYNKDKIIMKTGVQNGFQLELYTTAAFDNMNNYSINNGWRIYISDFVDFISYNYDGVIISNGYSTNIEINKKTISKQPYPYSSCINDLTTLNSYPSKTYKYTFLYNNNSYTADNCLNMCLQILLIENCNCCDVTAGSFPGPHPVCATDEQIQCDTKIWADFLAKNYFLNVCDCPLSCNLIDYIFKTSMNDFPSKFYADYLLSDANFRNKFPSSSKNISYEQVRQSLSSVNIYYNQMTNKITSEEPKKPLIYFISEIGGTVSLFIGVSFLSLFEFVEILMQTIFIYLEKRAEISSSKIRIIR